MSKLLIFLGSSILGWVGWWLGDQLSGMTAALVLSGIGTIVGVYYGWRINRDYFE